MQYQDVIDLIEEKKETEEVLKLKETLFDHLKKLPEADFRNRGLTYYYLVHVTLSFHSLYETVSCKHHYQKMLTCFEREEDRLLSQYHRGGTFSHQLKDQIDQFYKLMERSFATLESLYRQKGFMDGVRQSYELKMTYRKRYFWWQKNYGRWFSYAFLQVTSKYGDSFFRWGLTSLVFAFVMAGIFALLDYALPIAERMIPPNDHWYDYIYFSIATLTTLGFGDITPLTFIGKLLTSMEVFFGYIMLGIFITLIQKKL